MEVVVHEGSLAPQPREERRDPEELARSRAVPDTARLRAGMALLPQLILSAPNPNADLARLAFHCRDQLAECLLHIVLDAQFMKHPGFESAEERGRAAAYLEKMIFVTGPTYQHLAAGLQPSFGALAAVMGKFAAIGWVHSDGSSGTWVAHEPNEKGAPATSKFFMGADYGSAAALHHEPRKSRDEVAAEEAAPSVAAPMRTVFSFILPDGKHDAPIRIEVPGRGLLAEEYRREHGAPVTWVLSEPAFAAVAAALGEPAVSGEVRAAYTVDGARTVRSLFMAGADQIDIRLLSELHPAGLKLLAERVAISNVDAAGPDVRRAFVDETLSTHRGNAIHVMGRLAEFLEVFPGEPHRRPHDQYRVELLNTLRELSGDGREWMTQHFPIGRAAASKFMTRSLELLTPFGGELYFGVAGGGFGNGVGISFGKEQSTIICSHAIRFGGPNGRPFESVWKEPGALRGYYLLKSGESVALVTPEFKQAVERAIHDAFRGHFAVSLDRLLTHAPDESQVLFKALPSAG